MLSKCTSSAPFIAPSLIIQSSFESAKSVASIVAVAFPFSLDSAEHSLPQFAHPVSLHTSFTQPTINGVESLKWALQQGKPVDIAIETPLTDALFENLEDLLSKAINGLSEVPPIILCMYYISLLMASC